MVDERVETNSGGKARCPYKGFSNHNNGFGTEGGPHGNRSAKRTIHPIKKEHRGMEGVSSRGRRRMAGQWNELTGRIG